MKIIELEQRMNKLFLTVSGRFEKIEKRMDRMDKRLDKMEWEIHFQKLRNQDINERLDYLEAGKVRPRQEDLEGLECRSNRLKNQ